MSIDEKTLRAVVVGCSAALLTMGSAIGKTTVDNSSAPSSAYSHPSGDAKDEARGAARDVDQASAVIQRMMSDPKAGELLHAAKGVFVVPKFGQAAVGIGGQGGVGLLLVKHGGAWSDPAFYNFGGVSAGAQIGAEGGSFVLVLNNDKAVDRFMRSNNWSLDADAGLTIVKWSKEGRVSAGKGDITLWSDAMGLFAGAAVGVTDIKFDQDQTSAYYSRNVVASDVVNGKVSTPQADALKQVLAATAGVGNAMASASKTATGASTRTDRANSTSGMASNR